MNPPVISVILPAYNCEAFLAKAIQSVLDQSFTDFELIIINDGSTDRTREIIHSFSDPRIIYLENEKNRGLIFSLNRAIDTAKGKFIARMDADDICHSNRFLFQKKFLEEHEAVAVVASTVQMINVKGEPIANWELDRQCITPEKIREMMPWHNCIAHPTVMFRADVIKKLKYRRRQKNIEDYDLWLRMLNRGYLIAKLDEPLLLYRLHENSVTEQKLRKHNQFFKHLRMKRRFLAHEIIRGNISPVIFKVMVSAFKDIIMGVGKGLKNLFKN